MFLIFLRKESTTLLGQRKQMKVFELALKNEFGFVNQVTYQVIYADKKLQVKWVHVPSTFGICIIETPCENVEDWKQIYLWEVKPIAQKEFIALMQDDFPWAESSWVNKTSFEEWDTPSTLIGKLFKATHDSIFCVEFTQSEEWNELIKESTFVEETNKNEPWWKREYLVETEFGYFEYMYGMDHGARWAKLKELSEIDVDFKKTRIEKLRNKREKLNLLSQEDRLRYSRNAGRIAKLYGISFSVVLHSFKGNEENVVKFINTLKEAFEKEYSEIELSCGRERKRAEIKRLGIEIANADPNYIAPYILACIREKKLIK